jgi:L-ascorbate metabolism protein UlaG (beta-lactamase superfamily)
MEITWLGHSCFRLRSRDTIIVTDPPSPEKGFSLPSLNATIVTVSHAHAGHNCADICTGSPRIIEGPGEYEVGGVLMTGVRTYHDDKRGAERGRNTVFVVEVEDMRLCHLGDLGHIPSPEQREAMTDIDILLVPVGGHSTIDAAGAAEVASLLEPKIVIPMHYRTDLLNGDLDPIDPFLKQMGVTEASPQARLTVTQSNLPSQTQVTVLEQRH